MGVYLCTCLCAFVWMNECVRLCVCVPVCEWRPLARPYVIDAPASGYVGGNGCVRVCWSVLVHVCVCVQGVTLCRQTAAGERWPALIWSVICWSRCTAAASSQFLSLNSVLTLFQYSLSLSFFHTLRLSFFVSLAFKFFVFFWCLSLCFLYFSSVYNWR